MNRSNWPGAFRNMEAPQTPAGTPDGEAPEPEPVSDEEAPLSLAACLRQAASYRPNVDYGRVLRSLLRHIDANGRAGSMIVTPKLPERSGEACTIGDNAT
ncbi:MAG: hypothetical protein SF069_11720 [Phycisphaerae bacterium]|nr:hypothetical protein [Phycisphaerae bacterium]